MVKVYVARNGAHYIKLANGQTRFVSKNQRGGFRISNPLGAAARRRRRERREREAREAAQEEFDRETFRILGEGYAWHGGTPRDYFDELMSDTLVPEPLSTISAERFNRWIDLGLEAGIPQRNLPDKRR